MSMKLEAERVVLREIIRRLHGYNKPKNEHIYREIDILKSRIKEIELELGVNDD